MIIVRHEFFPLSILNLIYEYVFRMHIEDDSPLWILAFERWL